MRRVAFCLLLGLATLLAASAPEAAGQATLYGTGCAGLNPEPAIFHTGSTTPLHFGTVNLAGAPPFATVVVLIGTQNQNVGAAPIPVDLSSIGGVAAGCLLWTDPFFVNPLIVINADVNGEVAFSFATPAGAGEDLYFQWAVTEQIAPLSVTLTQGLHIHITAVAEPSVASMSFPATTVGDESAAQTVTFTNNTDASIEMTDVIVVGDPGFNAAFDLSTPIVVPPGGTTDAQVTFMPNSAGERSATLQVIQNGLPSGFNPTEVSLTGVGLGPAGSEVLVNAGGPQYVDTLFQVWSSEFGATGGELQTDATVVTGTTDPTLYQTFRKGPSFSYDFDVPNANYDLTLHLAETRFSQVGDRVFDVSVEGATLVDDLDLFATVGADAAHVLVLPVTVADGHLDIDFLGETSSDAIIHAMEIRSRFAVASLDQTSLDFGTLAQGGSLIINVELENVGNDDLVLDTIDFNVTTGAGHEFIATVAGVPYSGLETSSSTPVAPTLVLAPAATAMIPVEFAPTEHLNNNVDIVLKGNFDPVTINCVGAGGQEGDPFMHVVIEADALVVDYDETGAENIFLKGIDSHTHEPGHELVSFEWKEGPTSLSTSANVVLPFPLGPHTVSLTITDDSVPARELTDTWDFEVINPDEIPGVLAFYYTSGANPVEPLLDAVPATADYAEVRTAMHVVDEGGVGGSPFSESVMVRLMGVIDVATADTYEFDAVGGTDTRLEINGVPYTALTPIALASGLNSVEARFAVANLSNLPLEVTMAVTGFAQAPIPAADLTHDATLEAPVINTMPTEGITLGGNRIVMEGFGFFPDNDVTVHWGATDLVLANFVSLDADVIEFFSPPHAAGVIQVTVETSRGTSNAFSFTYDEAATPPINFTMTSPVSVNNPTCGVWGPDNRLYVALRSGEILAVDFDEDYNVLSQTTYPGVSGFDGQPIEAHEILGLAINPYDPPSPVRLYVAHSELFAQGGDIFTGTSPYPGQVSVLEGPDFDYFLDPQPLITGLPVSNHDHGVNGMDFDNNGDLLIAVGGNTNAGIKSAKMGDLPESPLAGAILKAATSRPDFNGVLTYNETIGGAPNNDQVFGDIVDVAPGSHVTVHASGLRNPYDLVFTTWGMLYCTDNGPNSSFGPESIDCSTVGQGVGGADELLLVEYDNYYGHPNRARGRTDARQCTYHNLNSDSVPGVYSPPIANLSSSTDGIMEYRSTAFLGQLYGDIMVEKWNNPVKRVVLSTDKRSVLSSENLSPNLSSLDVVQAPGGVIIGMDYSTDVISVLIPDDLAAVLPVTAYDIFPWRAPASGGGTFTIGGHNFVPDPGQNTVTIGGISATVTAATDQRIEGIIPANLSPTTDLLDVTVTSGGVPSTIPASFRYLFEPAGNEPGRWNTASSMPDNLGEVAAGIIDGILYVVGEGTTKTYAYDIEDDSWDDTLAVRTFAGSHHAAEVYDGKLYLIGGLDNGADGKVQIYDPVLDSWSAGTDMPWAGGSVSTALLDGLIYAAGGIVGSQTVDNTASYDPVLDSWTALASVPMGKGRNHSAAGTDGQYFWVFGGRGFGSGPGNFPADGFDSVQRYDPLADTWETSDNDGAPPGGPTLTPVPQNRGGMGKAVYFRDEFYVFGGETQNDPGGNANANLTYDRVDVYDPATNSWRLEAEMPVGRHGIFPVIYQGRVFVAGGGPNKGPSQSSFHHVYTRQ